MYTWGSSGLLWLKRQFTKLCGLPKRDCFEIFFHELSYEALWRIRKNTCSLKTETFFKGSDRLCKVVELSMQCFGKLLFGFIWDILNFLKICKSWVQNSYFGGGYVFRISFLKLLNNDDIKCKKALQKTTVVMYRNMLRK